jgi:hypothetical protein
MESLPESQGLAADSELAQARGRGSGAAAGQRVTLEADTKDRTPKPLRLDHSSAR